MARAGKLNEIPQTNVLSSLSQKSNTKDHL